MKKEKTISLDEGMLMWTSYRYCIGRKTYVTTLAPYIGQKYYPLLSDERKEFTSMDIRREIARCLDCHRPSFSYDHTINEKDRNPIADFCYWINNNICDEKGFANIKEINCYKENYKDIDKKFEVVTTNKSSQYVTLALSDITDLFCWETLASLFDVENHVKVFTNYNGKEEAHVCFKRIRRALKPSEDGKYLLPVAWRFEEVYTPVERYLELGEYAGYIASEYITKIEKI